MMFVTPEKVHEVEHIAFPAALAECKDKSRIQNALDNINEYFETSGLSNAETLVIACLLYYANMVTVGKALNLLGADVKVQGDDSMRRN